jgi:protein involved in polysaccharide export with SLBB domain
MRQRERGRFTLSLVFSVNRRSENDATFSIRLPARYPVMLLSSMIFVLMLFQAAPPAKLANSGGPSKSEAPTTYTLGSGDQIVIRAVDAEEIDNKPVLTDTRGNINLPTVGRIHAAGLITEELGTKIETRLKKNVNEPDATVALELQRP